MKRNTTAAVAFLFIGTLSLFNPAFGAQGDPISGYKLVTTIQVPGSITKNDIAWVDPATARFYLADSGATSASPAIPPRIVVIDTLNNAYVTSISLPSAANGVLSISRTREIWAGLTDSTVSIMSTDTNTIIGSLTTGGTGRADELAYDPIDRVIVIANDKDSPPFITFINEQTRTVIKKVLYDGVQAPQATNGLEQPVWDDATGKFYMAIPATKANPQGEVDEIDPLQMKITRTLSGSCGPAGLALIPNQRLITSCGDVFDILAGNLVTTVKGVGADEIWYNPGDQRVYFGGGTDKTTVPVVDANTYQLITSFVSGKLQTAPLTNQTSPRLAADAANNEIFVPTTGVGVEVWRNGATLTAFPSPVPELGPNAYTTTLNFNAPNTDTVEIRIGSPSGQLFYHGASRGSATTGAWVTKGMAFYLQDVSGGKTLTPDNTLATYVATMQESFPGF